MKSVLRSAVERYVEERYGFIGLTNGFDLTDREGKEAFIEKMHADVVGVLERLGA